MTDHPRNLASRLWDKDASLWLSSPNGSPNKAQSIADRLGWLHSIEWMQPRVDELRAWAGQIAGHYDRAILLGMGGSSLAAAVFASLFAPARGGLPLEVLDTTNPDEITRVAGGDLRRCLFIVASKSGTTVETVALYDFFYAQLAAQCADPQSRFVVITDAGSELQARASQAGGKIFINPSDVGGRYSALSYFGMVPAALLGVEIGELLERARAFCATTKSDDPAKNPALALGLLLGRNARAGRDKLILRLPRQLGVFGLWVEQLIAESTGKDGKGLVPVVVEDGAESGLGDDLKYGSEDRIHIDIHCGDSGRKKPRAGEMPARGPDWTLKFDDPRQLGAEFFRWEIATAIAAEGLGVNPFDQPDVARSKNSARAFIHGSEKMAAPTCRGDHYDLHWHAAAPQVGHPATAATATAIAEFCRTLEPKCYLGLLAYLPEDDATMSLLKSLREGVADRWGIVTTLGIGPRYLHSTGQLHKGGPPTGRFIQLVADFETDMPVPKRNYTFGALCRAQADGDFAVLAQAGRAVMRVRLKGDRLRALAAFVGEFTGEFAGGARNK